MGLLGWLFGGGSRGDGRPDWLPRGKRGRTGAWLLMEAPSGRRYVMRPRSGFAKISKSIARSSGSGMWVAQSSYDNATGGRVPEPDSIRVLRIRVAQAAQRKAQQKAKRLTKRQEKERKRLAAQEKADRERRFMEEIESSYRRGRL